MLPFDRRGEVVILHLAFPRCVPYYSLGFLLGVLLRSPQYLDVR